MAPHPTKSASPTHQAPASAAPPSTAGTPEPVPVGKGGSYRVGERVITFTEPAYSGATGQRSLITVIRYPLAPGSAGSQPAHGPLPMIVFAPGYQLCEGSYADLLWTWASAGYVVAAVNFPRTNCHLGTAAYEPDLVNQPRDVSYLVTQLLALNAKPGGTFSGLINPAEVGAAGQSDGGDTVAALAANGCCTDHRLRAVAVLSGAEWPPMPGRYFAHGAPPMLFAQGSADTVNPPWTSLQLYKADYGHPRYYLDLFGASHLEPYVGTNPVEQLAGRVTLAFFNYYLDGQASALATMKSEGNVSGTAALVSGGHLPP